MSKMLKNQGLGKLTARNKYYCEQHEQRWERRYKKKYPKCEGEFGSIGVIRWVEN